MLDVSFVDCSEIRMGSPFGVCAVVLTGKWVPDVPRDGWQNLSATSPDGRFSALLRWDTPHNDPGFKIAIIDSIGQTVDWSERHPGCCESIAWHDGAFTWRAHSGSIAASHSDT